VVVATALIGCLAVAASACSALTGGASPTYQLQADFSRGDNLFAPTPVKELGIPVGTVTSVTNEGDHVLAKMSIDRKNPLPAGARADVSQDSLLGQGFVQISPGYTGGPQLPDGSLIPMSRTSVPATTDELLSSLNKFLGSINPATAAGAVTSLATVLRGQGDQLNSLVHNASGTISILAQKGNDLGQLVGSLGQLTGTLNKQSGLIGQFINNYNTVSGVLATNRDQLAGAITHLNDATVQATALLQPNLAPLQQDVANLTTVGRGLDRNLNSLDLSLYSIAHLFGGKGYDPQHNWAQINLAPNGDKTTSLFLAQIADRLASVCRRLVPANPCGNPNFFAPFISGFTNALRQTTVPTPSNPGPNDPNPPNTLQAFDTGLQQIPDLSPAQRSQIAAGVSSPPPAPPGPASLSAPGANQLSAMPSTIDPSQAGGHSYWWIAILLAVLLAVATTAVAVLRRLRAARAR
jgi:virulence factor Mce-like protein